MLYEKYEITELKRNEIVKFFIKTTMRLKNHNVIFQSYFCLREVFQQKHKGILFQMTIEIFSKIFMVV